MFLKIYLMYIVQQNRVSSYSKKDFKIRIIFSVLGMKWQTLSYTYLYWRTLHNTLSPHAFRWIVWYSILQNFYLCKFVQPYNVRYTAAIIM